MIEDINTLYLDQKVGRTAFADSREHLFFSGYNYLGISHHPEFNELVQEGMSTYGWLFPSSRISNTRLRLYEAAESLLSTITRSEDTVLLPSGFTAGQLATRDQGPDLYNAPGSHPAIARNNGTHQNFTEWSKWLLETRNARPSKHRLVLASDSLSPLTATVYDFSFIRNFKEEVKVILDDSHGIGILEDGKGVSGLVPTAKQVEYTFTYSLSKAFGFSGGAISCNKKDADHFRSLPEYTAVSPLSPAMIYAFLRGQHVYSGQRDKLMSNISLFIEKTADLPGMTFDRRFPVFVLPPALDEKHFRRSRILISAFAYPDPTGPAVKRIVLNALHTPEDIETLAHTLRQAYNEIL